MRQTSLGHVSLNGIVDFLNQSVIQWLRCGRYRLTQKRWVLGVLEKQVSVLVGLVLLEKVREFSTMQNIPAVSSFIHAREPRRPSRPN